MLSLVLVLVLLGPQTPAAGPPDAATCLECHGDAALTMTSSTGATISLHVDGARFGQSVHAKLACADCHTGMTEIPHPTRTFRTARDVTAAYAEQCRRCHFANYTKTLDSVHQKSVARGDKMAPLCVDCHGAHDIQKTGAQPRTSISQTCARCHEGVATAYANSVHGRALNTPASGDVPACIDCHRAHDIAGPHQTDWQLHTVDLCGSCHANEALMKKYGLSTAVLKTYLNDFHGKTAALRSSHGAAPNGPVVARCTDCHGVHDIQESSRPDSPVIKANLVKTCRKCHADANENFPGAWLSHYEPSWKKAPMVYGVKLAYAVVIPLMIGGLGLQILLHLWRLMVNR